MTTCTTGRCSTRLSWGFCSVEADIWLVDGALLVAHERSSLDARRTLEVLYLRPLWERFQSNAARFHLPGITPLHPADRHQEHRGRDLPGPGPGAGILRCHAHALHRRRDEPGRRDGDRLGRTRQRVILGSSPRRAGIDGRLADLDGPLNRHQMPLVSDNWLLEFRWRGTGRCRRPTLRSSRRSSRRPTSGACGSGSGPSPRPRRCGARLYDAGVDLLNADDLGGLAAVLLKKAGGKGGNAAAAGMAAARTIATSSSSRPARRWPRSARCWRARSARRTPWSRRP